MKTYVKNDYEKRVRWTITVLQQGESGRQCGKVETVRESSITQMLMTTERTMPQRTSPLASHCTTERAHVVLFLAHFITLTLAQVESCPHFTSIFTPYMVVSLWLHLLHSLLSSLLPVCFPLPLLPPQRRAAAGAQQEDHGKPVRPRQQRGWGHLRRPLPHTYLFTISHGGYVPKIMGQTNNDGRISDLHFDKFTTPATFACWKISFKTEVCTCSQFPTEAVQWIKEVEMVDSVDDLKSSSSIRGISMPNFEVLDARIASALNRIIHNSQFKRRISLEEQKAKKKRTVSFVEDRSLTWSTSTSGSLEPTILSRIMPTYLLLVFEMMIFTNSIRNGMDGMEFHYQWRKSYLMTSWKDCTN